VGFSLLHPERTTTIIETVIRCSFMAYEIF
jgi:hypothetical protein